MGGEGWQRDTVLMVAGHLLFARQHRQYQTEGKVVPDEAIAEMKGG